jgi:hypothetical protein
LYDPPGSDGTNYNDEFVTIKNTGDTGVGLSGWVLKDAAGATFTFPAVTLAAGGTVKVHSGDGSNTSSHLYAGWGWTWNNSGDTAYLVKPGGGAADQCSYAGGGSTATC